MKELMFELTKGSPLKFQSLGWKTSDSNDYRRQFYALNHEGKPVVVSLKPAIPQWYEPTRHASAIFIGQPFPEAVCVEIVPCRLLAPPCFQSEEELGRRLLFELKDDRWKKIYVQTHDQVLVLDGSTEKQLREKLDQWLVAASKSPIDSLRCKDWLELTLKDIKQGRLGLRDVWMQEDWATRHGWDLGLMGRECFAFRRWLEEHTGTKVYIIDATSRPGPGQNGIAPPQFDESFESDPCFLEACASVRFRARFADNAKTVVYLSDCEVREELTTQELEDAANLKGSAKPVQASDQMNFRHSSNYRQVFWTQGGKAQQANLTRKQATAFAALHNTCGFVLSRDEWQQEIYGDDAPDEFRPDKIFAYRDGRRVWDQFIRVDGDRYRLVFEIT